MNPPDLEILELLPAVASLRPPTPLFVLLHDTGAAAVDMLALGHVLGDAFADAAVLIPQNLADTAGVESPAALAQHVEALAGFIRLQQRRFGALQSDTALAGFGAGSTLALALSHSHDGLVGRVLAFGGGYAAWPATAPALTTLHLLHGANDSVAPVARARSDFAHLVALGADATLDVVSAVGHELHPALMDQAVTRLQTCVPLRFWKGL